MAPTESKPAERRRNLKKMTATMRRSASFLALISAFVTVLLSNTSFAANGGGHERTCQDALVGNSYDCAFTFFLIGGSVKSKGDCVEFVTGGLSRNLISRAKWAISPVTMDAHVKTQALSTCPMYQCTPSNVWATQILFNFTAKWSPTSSMAKDRMKVARR